VRFTLDADGLLRVAAREERSGAAAEIEVRPRHGLTDGEVERMLREAWDHAEEDLRARRIADLRERLGVVARATVKQLPGAGAALPAPARLRIAEALEDAEDALAETAAREPGALQGVLDELEAATLPLAEALMESLAAGALAGRRLEEFEPRADAAPSR
jgi:molecular chaperone DnaK (HSP70)